MLDPNKSQHSSSENPEESLNDSFQTSFTEQIITNNVQHNDGEFGQECIQSADESQDESDVDEEEDDDDETENDDEETEDEWDEEENDSDAAENENENNSAFDKGRMSPNSAPTCYICLNNFEGQDIGSPDSCENMHHFCLECIEEWSKQINTCPVDRKSFSFIIVRRVINGEIVMKVPTAKKSVVEIVTMGEDLTYCEICGRCDREDRLLLCDGCDFGYHCECLVPPLETIPVDEWFCPDCFQRLFGHGRNNHRQRQRQLQQQRRVARTGAFERVRNRILALRSNIPTRSSRTAATVRRKTKRKPRRKRTRKTKSKATKTTTKKGTRKRTKKSRKRTRKSKFSMQRLPAADPRSRLATRLGLVCKSPFGLPTTKASANSNHPQNRSVAEVRYTAGINNLSLFGYELEVYNPVSYGDEDRFDRDTNFEIQADVGGGSIGLLTNPRFYTRNVDRKSIQAPEPSLLQMTNVDVLSEIMNSQKILHASSRDLSVARDGRVYLNPDSMKNNHNNNHRQCPNSSPPSSSSNHGHSSSSSSNSSWNDNNKNTTNTSITSNNTGNSENNSSYGQSSYNNSSSNMAENNEDISFVKPSPVVSLIDDKNDIEMYSDIESIGDNKDLDDNEENNKKLDDKPVNTENDINQQEQQQLKPSVPDTNTDDGEKMPESSNSSSIITVTKASSLLKRRPSIKDLFGGDSEEEDDGYGNDLKQLVAQQGSINVHFPIKMPIVLKSNFLTPKKRPLITTSISSSTLDGNGSKNVQVDEISISKKWVPIYPEMNATMKKVGPKWKAIGETEKQPLDKRNATVVVENDGEKARKNHSEKSDFAKVKSYLDDDGDHDNRKHENVISDKKRHSSSDKVRTCKHGRPLNKSNKEPSNLKRSHSETASSDASKKPKQADMKNSAKFEDYEKLNVIKHSKTTKIETAKREQSLDLHMMMDIEEKFLYKDETIILKKSDDQNFDLHKHRRKQPMDDDTPTPSKQISKTLHRLESKAICSSNYKVDQDKSLSSGSSSSKLQLDEYRDSSSREQHHHRSFSNKEFNDSKHHHHHRRHHHHRHHHSSSRHRQEPHDSVDYSHRSSRTGRQANDDDNYRHKTKGEKIESKSKNHHQQSFSNVQLDSKEIFAEGDKIIINVNFKKEQEKLPLEEKNKKKNTEPPKNLIIEAQSPKDLNIDEEEEGVLFEDKSPDISVASPNDDEFDNYVNLIKTATPTSSLSSNDKIPNSTILAEELNFLPRLNTNSSNNGGSGSFQNQPDRSPGSKSPDDLFIDDYSFLPTPTQDESQSPVLDSGHQRKQFNDNNSNNRKADVITVDDRDKIDEDFYDPELPLQSPDHFNDDDDDDDSMIKSPKLESSSNMSISNANLIGKDSSSSLSSDLVAAAAKLATFNNSINFSQIMNNMNKNTFKNQQNAHGDNNGGGGGSNSYSKFTGNNQSSSNYNINKGHSSETINNSDIMEIVDMDVESPGVSLSPAKSSDTSNNNHHSSSSLANVKEIWDQIVKKASTNLQNSTVATSGKKISNNGNTNKSSRSKSKAADVDATQPVSAVEMNIKEKYITKLNRQERVVEEVKLALKPYYKKKKINKDEYKDILRKAVPKICHSKSGEINPSKIFKLIEAYIKHMRRLRKKN